MNITFIAPPASGKGTQSLKISEEYGLVHISTCDLLRNIQNEEIEKQLDNGLFVSDDIICKLLMERISKSDCDKGYVLDGFPRNLAQAKKYEEMLKRLNKKLGIIIVLDIDKNIALNRIVGRQNCPKCGAVFNDIFPDTKSKVKGICDMCGSHLVKRDDDNAETFEKRYQTYIKETAPVIDYFKDNVYHVDSSINSIYTFSQIKKIIGGVYDKY